MRCYTPRRTPLHGQLTALRHTSRVDKAAEMEQMEGADAERKGKKKEVKWKKAGEERTNGREGGGSEMERKEEKDPREWRNCVQ